MMVPRTRRFSRRPLAMAAATLACAALQSARPVEAQTAVLTQHNDNSRTGANLNETVLNTSNVNATKFGKLYNLKVDGYIYAQPLYVANVRILSQGVHNVVYVATMNNNLYAFDADNGAKLWVKNYGPPVPASDVQPYYHDISGNVGILSTPVIDPGANTIYFVSRNKNQDGSYHQWLNAADITSGASLLGGPKEIRATYGGLTFDPRIQNQRPALTLANGNIYIAWASHNDAYAYHGWVMAYAAHSLNQTGVYVDTPPLVYMGKNVGSNGGIWQAGQGATVDGSGNVYFSTGNGTYTSDGANTGNSFVKLAPSLALLDWFTPYNSDVMNGADEDLGSAGLLGLPDTHYLLGGGKQGMLYLVDTHSMGRFNSSSDHVVQEWQAVHGVGSSHIHGTPVYLHDPVLGPAIYIWGENDFLRAYAFNAQTGLFNTTAVAKSAMTAPVTNANGAMPGGFLSISSNNGQKGTGIVWATTPYNANANNAVVQGIVHAFDASTLKELWNDKMNAGRDEIGNFAKFCPPTVANGKVYVPTFGPLGSSSMGALAIYGTIPLPNYPNGFKDMPGITLNGSAQIYGSRVRLTQNTAFQAGSVFFSTPVPITAFHTTFQFQIYHPDADGLTFTVQGVGPTALGGPGGGLGYGPDPGDGSGAKIEHSACVKFDLYSNKGEGVNSTGLFTNGMSPTLPAYDLTGLDLHSGHIFTVTLAYSGTTLTETLSDNDTHATFTKSYAVNLSALVGSNLGYVGFTGGTGGLTSFMDVVTWVYND